MSSNITDLTILNPFKELYYITLHCITYYITLYYINYILLSVVVRVVVLATLNGVYTTSMFFES